MIINIFTASHESLHPLFLQERMKVVNKKKKEEADARFGALLRKQVNDHTQRMNDTADADTLFAKLEDATVNLLENLNAIFCIHLWLYHHILNCILQFYQDLYFFLLSISVQATGGYAEKAYWRRH